MPRLSKQADWGFSTASIKPMKSSESLRPSPRNAARPANSRLVLAQLATSSVQIEEVQYTAGTCLARHAQAFPFLACTVEGIHWSSHNHGGHTCRPGSVRFIPAGEPHENYFPARSRCLLVKLQEPILERAREYSVLPSGPGQLATPAAATLSELLRMELHQNDDLSLLAAEELSLQLLLTGARDPMSPAAPIPAWLHRILELLQEESERRLTLAELARCAGRHPVQVCRQFHRRFSCTISEYVRRLRIARAQSLLLSSTLGIAEIALECGFSDQSQFTTAFRRLTGLPPCRFRKQFVPAPLPPS